MGMPEFTEEEVQEFVELHYGLHVLKLNRCDGYDDLTYLITVDGVSSDAKLCSAGDRATREYALKIMSESNSRNTGHLEAEIQLIRSAVGKLNGILVPGIAQTKNRSDLEFIQRTARNGDKGPRHAVRLSDFISGHMMFGLETEPRVETLVRTGRLVAELELAFKNFDHPHARIGTEMLWSLHSVATMLPDRLSAVEDPMQLAVFEAVIEEFDEALKLLEPDLEHGVIHGDLNEGNIVMEKSVDGRFHLKGVIDFSDSHRTFTVFELALAIAYMMLECQKKQTVPVLDVGGFMLSGYSEKSPALSQRKLEFLKTAIEARITQSLVIGQYVFKHEQPGNLYVLNTQKHGWAVLQKLRSTKAQALLDIWGGIVAFNNPLKQT